MNRRKIIFGLALVFIFFAFCIPVIVSGEEEKSQGATIVEQMRFPELKFNQPELDNFILKNGLSAYLLKNNSQIVNLTAIVRAGAIYESRCGAGLASFAGYVIKSCGASKDCGKFNERLNNSGIFSMPA